MNNKNYDIVKIKGIIGIILSFICLIRLSLPYRYNESFLIDTILVFCVLGVLIYSIFLSKDYLIRIMKGESY